LWQALHVPAKSWEALLPASRFCACAHAAGPARQLAKSVTAAKMRARLNIIPYSPDAENASSAVPKGTSGVTL
jgi:hypothetical protein